MKGLSLDLLLSSNPLFSGLSKLERQKLHHIINLLGPNDFSKPVPLKIIQDSIFIISDGDMSIEHTAQKDSPVEKLLPGDVWVGKKLKNADSSHIKIKVSESISVFSLRLSDLYYQVGYKRIYQKIRENGLLEQVPSLKHLALSHNYLWTFNHEELERRISSMRHFIYAVLLSLIAYIFLIEAHTNFAHSLGMTLAITIATLLILLIGLSHVMKKSAFPPSAIGLTFSNSRQAIGEAMLGVIPLFLITLFILVILKNGMQNFYGAPLVIIQEGLRNFANNNTYWAVGIIYGFIYVPLQELVFRGGMQGMLQVLYADHKEMTIPIVTSNVVFATTYFILSPLLAILVFFPGLYWGWLFARHHNLIGVCISHFLWAMSTYYVISQIMIMA